MMKIVDKRTNQTEYERIKNILDKNTENDTHRNFPKLFDLSIYNMKTLLESWQRYLKESKLTPNELQILHLIEKLNDELLNRISDRLVAPPEDEQDAHNKRKAIFIELRMDKTTPFKTYDQLKDAFNQLSKRAYR